MLRTILFALAFTVLSLFAAPAGAASLTVNSLGDEPDSSPGNGVCSTGSSSCTLRAAIQEANALLGDDTIGFGVTGTIELASPLPNITTSLVINGPGTSNLTVDGNATGTVFTVSGIVSIAGLTITGGNASGVSNFGTLTMSRVSVTANTATHGGGVATWVDSELTMNNSSVSFNSSGNGGGLHASTGATVTLTNSTINRNTASGEGGGIWLHQDTSFVSTFSTFDSNSASGTVQGGGGIYTNGNATLSSTTVTKNSATRGGGIYAGTLADVDVINSTVETNAGGQGAGIFTTGVLSVTASGVRANTASTLGGGIYSAGESYILETSIKDNAAAFGAGLFNGSGANRATADVASSTFSGNSATQNGGAVQNSGAEFVATNATFSGNTAVAGGAIYNIGSANFTSDVSLFSSTLAANTAATELGGGIRNDTSQFVRPATAVFKNTILANTAGENCSGVATTSAGYNLSSDASCAFMAVGDQSETNPRLGLLASNGGPTSTHALLDESPAIDAGSPDCPPPEEDQRGISRSRDGDNDGENACDIGAFEVEGEERSSHDDDFRRPRTPTPTPTSTVTPTFSPAPSATPGLFDQRGGLGAIVGIRREPAQAPQAATPLAPVQTIRPPSTGTGGLLQ